MHIFTADIEAQIKKLLQTMTMKQKLGQLQQLSYGDETISEDIKQKILCGEVGSFLNVYKLDPVNAMQLLASQSRLKIPLLIGKDVIHGFRTVLPIPLAQAATFNPVFVEEGCRNAAIECSSIGIRWTFSPMVDIARDPRWGRIAEGCGEDPYLASMMGAAMVIGYQSKDLSDITAVAACGKHYVGYGATEGGRDYNTTLIPQNTLRDIYLTPFKALCDAGCQSYMSAFNDLNGQPSTGNAFTLKQVLRNQWGFDGLVVTDYTAMSEMIVHGFAQNEKDAARISMNAGIDMEMVSENYFNNLQALLQENKVSLNSIDTAVGNILRVKFRLGLFENSQTDPSRQKIILDQKFKETAKNIAVQAAVLLQNKNKTLPINKNIGNLAVIGALADDQENQIGCWAPDGHVEDSITPLTSLKQALTTTKIQFAAGYSNPRSTDTSLFAAAISACQQSQKILLFLGEDNGLSGQSNCRSVINLPGCQQLLVQQLAKLGKPIVVVIYAGRSLTIESILPYVDSVLYAWHLGTMAGPALADLLLGVASPTGKLPVTFLRSQGQIPLYYNKKNTGRPNDTHQYIPYTSSYIDIDSTPLFPFGFGLTYTTFVYSNYKMSRDSIAMGQSLIVSAIVKNAGDIRCEEIAMLFIRDAVGSYTRPVRQLKDFRRVSIGAGESVTVNFVIKSTDLKFWTKGHVYAAQPGKFYVFIGPNAGQGLMGSFDLTGQ